MNASKACIMITLFKSTGQGENHYTVSSVNTLRLNLNKFHDIDIKRRWTFQCLADLLAAGYIRRKARYVKDHNGLITQIPSMVTFALKGVVWLVKMGVKGAKEIYKSMIRFLKSGDRRWPRGDDAGDGSFWPADPEVKEGLEKMLGIVTEEIR